MIPRLHGADARRKDYPTPPGADPGAYTDDENEFIRAVAHFRTVNQVKTPTLAQLLWIAGRLGYARK